MRVPNRASPLVQCLYGARSFHYYTNYAVQQNRYYTHSTPSLSLENKWDTASLTYSPHALATLRRVAP